MPLGKRDERGDAADGRFLVAVPAAHVNEGAHRCRRPCAAAAAAAAAAAFLGVVTRGHKLDEGCVEVVAVRDCARRVLAPGLRSRR